MRILFEGIADVKAYYPNIPDKQFDSLIRLDPTFDEAKDRVGTYGKWILNLYNKNGQVDVWHITDLLSNFERNKKFLKNKDIMSFKSMEEVETYLADEESYNSETARQKLRATRAASKNVDLNKEAKAIYTSPHWSIVTPLTYEASCALGQGTKWCTASRNSREYFDSYNDDGPLYIVRDKDTGERYQLHFETESFMDEYDEPIDVVDLLLTNWDLYEAFDNIGALDEDFKNYEMVYSTLMDNDNVVKFPYELDEIDWVGTYGEKDIKEFIYTIVVEEGEILDKDSFYGCENVTEIRIPSRSNTISIEAGTFDETPILSDIYISPRVQHISNNATSHKNITVYGEIDSEAERWATYNDFEFVEVKDFDEKMQRKSMKFTLNESQYEHRYYLCGNYGLVGTPYPKSVTKEEALKKLSSGNLLPSWGYVHEKSTFDDGIRREVYPLTKLLTKPEDFETTERKWEKHLPKMEEDLLIEGIDDVRKFYPMIDKSDFDRIIRLDPTFRSDRDKVGTYGKWLLNLFKANRLDNEGHVRDLLTRFEEVKNQLKNKDIMKYKSLEEVDAMLDDETSYKDLSARQKLRQTQNAVRKTNVDEDASLVFEDSNWEVWVPHTYEASCKLGQGSTWCTASTSSDYYYRMYKNQYGGEYYININKRTKEKYQFHFESHQFMDENDYAINLEEFMNEPGNSGLSEFYLSIVNTVLDRELSDNGGEYKFSESQMIDLYTKCTDFSESLIKSLFWGEGLDFLGGYDYVEMSYARDAISKENLLIIEKIVRAELEDDEDTFTFDIDEVDDDDINDAIKVSYFFAEEIGAENECIEDFIKSKENLIYELHKNGYKAHWNEDNSLSISIIRNAEDSLYLLIMRNPNEADEEVVDAVADAIEFDEPYYGWQGFDRDYFNDDLADRLYEIANERGINTNETN